MFQLAVLDMMISTVIGPKAMGGTTRIACEEARLFASSSEKTRVHFLACAGSRPEDYFDGVRFHAIAAKAKVLCARPELASRNKVMARQCADYFEAKRVDAVISHSDPGLAIAIARLMPRLPVVFVHHLWPSTNKFFDLGRFRQLMEMDRLGVYVVFNSEPNRKRHLELAKKYGVSEVAKEADLCARFIKWASRRQDHVVRTLYAAHPSEFVSDRLHRHVMASRCGADKRVHSWAGVERPIIGLFTEWLGSEYEMTTKAALEKNPLWIPKFGASYTRVAKALGNSLSNLATGPTDSFGLTVFEAASMGTPSVLGRTGGYSAVENLLLDLGVRMPVVDYSGGSFVARAHAAMDDAASWSEADRRKLYDFFQREFAPARVLADRARLIGHSISLRT